MALFVSQTLSELDTPVDSSGRDKYSEFFLSNLSLTKSKSEEFGLKKKHPGIIGQERKLKSKSLSPNTWQSSLQTSSLSMPVGSSSGSNARESLVSSGRSKSELTTLESRKKNLFGSRERRLSESNGCSSFDSSRHNSSDSSGRSSSESRASSSPKLRRNSEVKPREIKLQFDKSFLSQQINELFYSYVDNKVGTNPITNDIKIMYGSRNILDFKPNTQSRLMINHPAIYTTGDSFSYIKNNVKEDIIPNKEDSCMLCGISFDPPFDYATVVSTHWHP